MAKKHRPRTKDLLPDEEDFNYVRDKLQDSNDIYEPAPTPKRPKSKVDYSHTCAFFEGQVVVIATKQIAGTVVNCVGKDLWIADACGVMHYEKEHSVYLEQATT